MVFIGLLSGKNENSRLFSNQAWTGKAGSVLYGQPFLKAWDETRFLAGYPGKEVVIARRKAACWHVAGINGEDRSKKVSIPFHYLNKGKTYRAELLADGKYDSGFDVKYVTVKEGDTLEVKCLPRGGFTLIINEM